MLKNGKRGASPVISKADLSVQAEWLKCHVSVMRLVPKRANKRTKTEKRR